MDATARPQTGTRLDRENPWPGLESYDEAAREFFSGRAAEAEELQRRIADEPMTVLFGKSGLGKTSLLKAGVFPRLREKGILPVLLRLQLRANTEPLIEQVRLALFEALRAQEIDHPPLRDGETLWEYLHRNGLEFWTRQNRLVRPVFVFDQFEELFTLGRLIPAEVAAFREDLADLAENRLPAEVARRLESDGTGESDLDAQAMPYKVVIALREDFLADLEGWRLTIPSLRRNRMRLLPMGPEQALQAVWNERTKHLVTEPVARKIVAFLSTGAATTNGGGSSDDVGATVEPALLSLFCQGVNEHRKQQGKEGFDEALLEGAKESIVTDFYRGSLHDQPDRVRRFVEDNLVTEHGFRNSYSVDDAVARGFVTTAELAVLVNRHLLRHEHHLGTARVELTHDLLTRAVMEERDARRTAERNERERRARRRLGAIAVGCLAAVVVLAFVTFKAVSARHDAENARIDALKATDAAERAQGAAVKARDDAVRAEGDAVRAEKDADAQRIKADGLRRTAETQLVALAKASKKLEEAREKAQQEAENAKTQKGLAEAARERARSKELTAQAETMLHRNPQRAALLALEGLKKAPTQEGRSVLLDAVESTWPMTTLQEGVLGGKPEAVALSADGERLAVLVGSGTAAGTEGKNQALTLWDVSAANPSQLWRQPVKALPWLAFSPNRSLLAVAGAESIDLWNVTTRDPVPRSAPAKGAWSVVFSPDGRWLAWIQDDTIRLLDVRNEQAKPVTAAKVANLLALAVVADGNRIITVVKRPLSAQIIERKPDGNWAAATALPLETCLSPQSVSPGSQYLSATWPARACSSLATDKDAGKLQPRAKTAEATSDVVWSMAGYAFAELLLSGDIIVGRSDRFKKQAGNRIKGATLEFEENKLALISVNEPGTRVALIDRGREVRVYSLDNHKFLLSRFEQNSIAFAPDGTWIAVQRLPIPGGRAAIDVFALDFAATGSLARLRPPIEVDKPSTRIAELYAAPGSVIAVLSDSGRETTVVFDVLTGRPRFDPHDGRLRMLGAERQLLLITPTPARRGRVVKTGDGLELTPWEQVPAGAGPPVFVPSSGNDAFAVLRAQAGNPNEADAIVYSVRGDSLVASGQVIGLPAAVLSPPFRVQLSADARQLTATRLRTGAAPAETLVRSVTSAREPAVASAAPVRPFEVREDSGGANAPSRQLTVKRADGTIVTTINGARLRHRFSSDNRWLAAWNLDGIHVFDLVRNETAWIWSPLEGHAVDLTRADERRDRHVVVADVEFEARNTILKVWLNMGFLDRSPRPAITRPFDSVTLMPLDSDVLERFAKWLVPHGLTDRQRCRYGLDDEEKCRPVLATSDAQTAK